MINKKAKPITPYSSLSFQNLYLQLKNTSVMMQEATTEVFPDVSTCTFMTRETSNKRRICNGT